MRTSSTKSDVLRLLTQSEGTFLSGQEIASRLSLSRSAVWKAIRDLKEEGCDIESRTNRGYRLAGSARLLTDDLVRPLVKEPCRLHVYDRVGSTNDIVKDAEIGDLPLVVIANQQTAGRGRLGRPFASPAGSGIYISFGVRPSFDISRSLFVTMAAAVGVCRAIERVTGVSCDIKWVNDIFWNGKKICGILTEAQSNFETGQIDKLIIGIGINCYPGSYPEELADIAATLYDAAGEFQRAGLAAAVTDEILRVLEEVESRSFLPEYRQRCFILGQDVIVHPSLQKEGFRARALAVTDDGGLKVQYLEGPEKDNIRVLHTGEISVRLAD